MTILVQEYFQESARKYPDKMAVCCQEENISYQQLDRFSNAFARHLLEKGASRGGFVPFFMKKGVSSIKSILSILKADCAYIPIDVNSPKQRMLSILEASSSKLVIADNESFQQLMAFGLDEKLTIVNISEFTGGDESEIVFENLSIDLAYVLFTSGSTGVPKGVMIPHKAIIDYIDWCVETYQLTDKDVIANHAPLYFDNSTFDIYTAFKSGTTLHLVHDELNAVIPRLVKWIDEREISVFFCVPSVLTMLLRSRRLKADSFGKLRHLICAGEVLPSSVLAEWMDMYPHLQFTNMYGPTEITVDCTYHIIHQKIAPGASVPIGKARRNMEVFVRDEAGNLTKAIGAKGELLVRGTSVAYGYLGDREKTEKVFIQNPNNKFFHDTLYCTGDLVEVDQDGNVIFIGRADSQVKYLGYRIELGEIETAIDGVEGVEEVVVVFNDVEDEQLRCIGALVKLTESLTIDELRDVLRKRLPPYMVPTKLVEQTEAYPRTSNGKYDRKAILKMLF